MYVFFYFSICGDDQFLGKRKMTKIGGKLSPLIGSGGRAGYGGGGEWGCMRAGKKARWQASVEEEGMVVAGFS